MPQTLTLASAALRCTILPELGGAVADLWFGDTAVLRNPPLADIRTARQASSYALVPFSNRVGQATLQWQGTSHPLVRNNAAEPHAIHGVGWQRPWTVLESDAESALLAYEHKADGSWPFAFDSSQAFRLRGNVLEMTLGITNQSAAPAPVGLGWHPFFVKRSRSRIAFDATGRWEMGPDKLPTHRAASHGLDAACAQLDVDHCFDGWNGTAHLRDEALHIVVTSSLRRLVVFTNDTRDTVAIEPVSHVNNAVNLLHAGGRSAEELGVCVLQPGESLSAQMGIAVEGVK